MPVSVFGGRARVSAGLRNKFVQIEQAAPSAAASGMPIDEWTALGRPVWMSRQDSVGDERFAADQESAWGQTRWDLAYQADMDPELVDVTRLRRLNINGRIFDIRAASLMDRRLGITLMTLAKAD